MKVWQKVILGLILGFLVGIIFKDFSLALKPLGDLFIYLLKMLIVPLVFSSLFVGVTSLKDPKKMGRVGLKTLGIYLLTTAVAITIGLGVGTILKPGNGIALTSSAPIVQKEAKPFYKTLLDIIPQNPVAALADGEVLQIIVFALFLGVAINLIGERGQTVVKVFDGFAEAMYKLTDIVMMVAPYGVFALMAWVTASYGLDIIMPLFKLVAGLYIGCIIHALVLGAAVMGIARLNPIRFFKGIIDAQVVAFSTTSSSATLPYSIGCCKENLGVSNTISSFVLPLGATINMDGTALYQGVAALFIAQAYGIDLTLGNYMTIILTATLASIGSAGIPGAGLIMLTLVLSSVGLPLEGIAIMAGVDRILDMARTTINVTGDCMVTLFVAKTEKELDLETYNLITRV